jgi:broad specificity phosphatase PhoE
MNVSAEPEVAAMTVIVVRHAEKVDDSDDPPLSEAGAARAEALVALLGSSPPDAIYASQYRRTQDTVAPAAARFGLEVRVDPVARPIEVWARRFAEQLIAGHPGETVLVAGHSNTVPALVAALCGCEVEAIDESVYDRIWTVSSPGTDAARLVVTRFGDALID